MKGLKIFGLGPSVPYASEVARHLGCDLSTAREQWRPDGEPWCASLSNVRGADVFVVSSLHGDDQVSVSEKTMQLLLFVDALKRASAARVTAVCPWLSFMRQDRKEGSREPVSTQALAKMFEAVGTDRLLTMDAHNPGALQNAYRIPIDLLEARKFLANLAQDIVFSHHEPCHEFVVLSPDAGGVKRAKAFQESLQKRMGRPVGFAHANKVRRSAVEVRVEIIGDVRGKSVVTVDDMIATGGTIGQIARAVEGAGGTHWGVVATHGLFVGDAPHQLSGVGRVLVADTIPPFRLEGKTVAARVHQVRTATLFAEAIRRIHSEDGSLSELLED